MAAGVSLRGDVLICPVVAHKTGGLGTRELLRRGTHADYCINIEHSTNTVATACVGLTTVRILTRSPGLHFRYTTEARAAYFNAIEQQAEIIRRLGPSIDCTASKRWLTFTPHPELPGFPVHRLNTIHKEKPMRACELLLEVRTVPRQTSAQVKADLEAVLVAISLDHTSFDCELSVPADGADDPGCFPPCEIAKDHPLAAAMAEGQQFASGQPAEVGACFALAKSVTEISRRRLVSHRSSMGRAACVSTTNGRRRMNASGWRNCSRRPMPSPMHCANCAREVSLV